MGGTTSSIISVGDAKRRCTFDELARIRRAYEQLGTINKEVFAIKVVGTAFPLNVANRMYDVLNGDSSIPLAYSEFLCGLVVILKGTVGERIALAFGILDVRSAGYINKRDIERWPVDKHERPVYSDMFVEVNARKMDVAAFTLWVKGNRDATCLVRWIHAHEKDHHDPSNLLAQFSGGSVESLGLSLDTLYSKFQQLRLSSPTSRVDRSLVASLLSPPLSNDLIDLLFTTVDRNGDGVVDFGEFVVSLSECLSGSSKDKLRFCFRVFDIDGDGRLSQEEMLRMLRAALPGPRTGGDAGVELVEPAFSEFGNNSGLITFQEFVVWAQENPNVVEFVNTIGNIAMKLGLRPPTRQAERKFINAVMAGVVPRAGGRVFLVEAEWWMAWLKFAEVPDVTSSPPPGPIMNSSLIDSLNVVSQSGAPYLREGLAEDYDFFALPEKAWTALVGWYGGGPALPRRLIKAGCDDELRCELYPLRLALVSKRPRHRWKPAAEAYVSFSRTRTIKELAAFLCDEFFPAHNAGCSYELVLHDCYDALHPVRLRADQTLEDARIVQDHLIFVERVELPGDVVDTGRRKKRFMSFKKSSVPEELKSTDVVSSASDSCDGDAPLTRGDAKEVKDIQMKIKVKEAVEFEVRKRHNWVHHNPSPFCAVVVDGTQVFATPHMSNTAAPVWNATTEVVLDASRGRLVQFEIWDRHNFHQNELMGKAKLCVDDLPHADGQLVVDRMGALTLEMKTNDGQHLCRLAVEITCKPAAGGLTGLRNLGNTCFMNSALQCLTNVRPVTAYFLRNYHLAEVNLENPLGHRGLIAKRYGELTHELWEGYAKSISPRTFRWQIGKLQPAFAGGNQQDTQEFLSYLLDGLHEDLNRVTQKPYVEDPDSNGRPDEEVATEYWGNYLKRNQSIMVDVFTGQIKSSVTCVVCGFESVRFDPFNTLSLPVPEQTKTPVCVRFVPSGRGLPVDLVVSLEAKQTAGDIKDECRDLLGLEKGVMWLCKVENHTIVNYVDEHTRAGRITEDIWAFELAVCDEGVPRRGTDFHPSTIACKLLQRRVTKAEVYFVSPIKIELMGSPLLHVLEKPSRVTGAQMYRSVWAMFVDFFVDPKNGTLFTMDSPPTAREAQRLLEEEGSAPGTLPAAASQSKYPFILRVVNSDGTRCGKCSWDRFCVGCEIPSGQAPCGVEHLDDIAVDWNVLVLAAYHNANLAAKVHTHATAEEHRRKLNQPSSLSDCFAAFSSTERLTKDDTWRCPKCKDFREASKKLDLWKAPPVLIIHLKRFRLDPRYNVWRKSAQLVDFPTSALRVPAVGTGWEQGDDQQALYDLFAITNHYGALGGGHYTAAARHVTEEKWFCFNDDAVIAQREDKLVTSAAYVLFYARRDLGDGTHLLPDVSPPPPDSLDIPSDTEDEGRTTDSGRCHHQ